MCLNQAAQLLVTVVVVVLGLSATYLQVRDAAYTARRYQQYLPATGPARVLFMQYLGLMFGSQVVLMLAGAVALIWLAFFKG